MFNKGSFVAGSIGAGVAGSGDGAGGRATGSSDWRKRPRKDWGEEGEKLVQQVWDLGRYAKESPNRGRTELQLAERLRRALRDKNCLLYTSPSPRDRG